MAKLSKKKKALAAKIEPGKAYSVADAVAILSEFATGKFKESLDVSVNLGIDARKSDQAVRLYCPQALVKKCVLRFSLKARMQRRRKQLAQTSLVLMTSPKAFRQAT